ncbi:MAG: PDZ domain-containing protein [Pseudoxanthomonas sp.]|nr:PDZ domain-containing protein [Pseudoxanthomonas sp.]
MTGTVARTPHRVPVPTVRHHAARWVHATGLLFVVLLALPCIAAAQPRSGRAPAGYELDAVVDVRRASAEGPRVMAVTPGGAADRMGLRAGDRLQSVNGRALAGAERPAPLLDEALRAGGGRLRVEVLRGTQPLSLSGTLEPGRSAGGGGCGQLTDRLDGLPAVANVRPVDIVQVEGLRAPVAAAARHPVAAGTRVVIVREHVPAAPSRPLSTFASKALVLDVEADSTYFLGARPLAGGGADGWEPFVWQTLREPCH